VDERFRSVLYHPLGLPLVCMLNGKNPGSLSYLARESKFHNDGSNTKPSTEFDSMLSHAVQEWVEKSPTKKKRTKAQLTQLLSDKIQNECSKTGFYTDTKVAVDDGNIPAFIPANRSKPQIDILLTPSPDGKDSKVSSTPFAVIGVGCKNAYWWKKVDQNIKFLSRMGDHQPDTRLRFKEPLLCAVLTIEDEEEKLIQVKLGAFLCSPNDASGGHNNFQLTRLWHVKTNDLEEASKAFGKLLRTTSDFSRWREASPDVHRFEYFSSNCSRVGNFVSGVRIPMVHWPWLYDS